MEDGEEGGKGALGMQEEKGEGEGWKSDSFCDQWHLRMTQGKDILRSGLCLEINEGLLYVT